MEVDGTDERSDGVQSRLFRRICWMEKKMRDVTKNENALDTEINLGSMQIGKVDPPFFFPLVGMRFENKTINPIRLSQISLMISSIMFVHDFGVQTKEWR